jgi:carbonic anhydrase/acetyltransferase-like protein (isoleucine patch superfamily)
MSLYALGDKTPSIHATAFVHPDAVIIGDVRVGPESSVWPTAVLRGDHGSIVVGAQTSIQDGTIVHCTSSLDTVIGDRCVVGHNVHLEGCTIEDDCLIGSGSVVLHRVVVRSGALVGAQALVPNGTEVPSGAMALGVPARIRTDAVHPDTFADAVAVYVHNASWYKADLRRLD